MDCSFQTRRTPVSDNAKYVMEGMVYGYVKYFIGWNVNNKWDAVKKEKLCFCCLGDGHYSKDS